MPAPLEIGTKHNLRDFNFFLHRGGNKDDVPREGFQWTFYWNGQEYNSRQLSGLTVALVPHTLNVNAIGFRFRNDVSGTLRVKGVGHGLAFDETYAVPLTGAQQGSSGATIEARLSGIEKKLDAVLERLPATVK